MNQIQTYTEHFTKTVNHHLGMTGESVKDFAKRCGKSTIAMQNYINGDVSPSLRSADNILTVINENK